MDSLDLPLLSNLKDIHIFHTVLDLNCDFNSKTFNCSALMLCEAKQCSNNCAVRKQCVKTDHLYSKHTTLCRCEKFDINGKSEESTFNAEVECLNCNRIRSNSVSDTHNFVMILDSHSIEVASVNEVQFGNDGSFSRHQCGNVSNGASLDPVRFRKQWRLAEIIPMEFSLEDWCLKIWKDGVKCGCCFPKCLEINYKTKPEGESLKWTMDQDGKPCVFTHGHWINNRSLFPSQDIPEALATWSAHVNPGDNDLVVLMTGDSEPVITGQDVEDIEPVTYHFASAMAMPSSTLALAIGHWSLVDTVMQTGNKSQIIETQPELKGNRTTCRLFTPQRLKEAVRTLISPYIPQCLTAAEKLLGQYPFKRLDILIVPNSFQSLGMASPSLMFLSQSVLAPGGEMLLRVAHELSHSWFGLLIGPQDWHEEWLSEGFCTYTEAVIHNDVLGKSQEQFHYERHIFDFLKYKTLLSEIENTPDDLQHLRVKPSEENVIKNGMNPDKAFLQLHYIKGYFLLKYMEEKVSVKRFRGFLSTIVCRFHHKLITSKDVLDLYFELFSDLRSPDFNEDTLAAEWLDSSELPKHLLKIASAIEENPLVLPVLKLMELITNYNSQCYRLHWQKRRKLSIDFHEIPMLQNVQVIYLLEQMLTRTKFHRAVIERLFSHINYENVNPDVGHRMCELIIKNKVSRLYGMVHEFLINHQAMGVYLFGELIISLDKQQRNTAETAFTAIRDGMDEGVKRIVQTMIYGDV